MKIGITELIVIFIVALFAVGPDKLPAYAKKLGEALAQFRKYSEEATRDIKESIVEPLEEAQRPLKEAMEPLSELDKTVRDNVKDVQDSFAGIGKTKKESKEKTVPASKEAVSEEDKPMEAVEEKAAEAEAFEAVTGEHEKTVDNTEAAEKEELA